MSLAPSLGSAEPQVSHPPVPSQPPPSPSVLSDSKRKDGRGPCLKVDLKLVAGFLDAALILCPGPRLCLLVKFGVQQP